MPTRDCPSRDELLAYSSGALAEEVAGALIDHLSECPGCQEALQALAASDESLMARLRRPAWKSLHRRALRAESRCSACGLKSIRPAWLPLI